MYQHLKRGVFLFVFVEPHARVPQAVPTPVLACRLPPKQGRGNVAVGSGLG